jgi:hypothetical protein
LAPIAEDKLSASGKMALHGNRACAFAALHNDATAGKEMDYVKSNEKDGWQSVVRGSVCTNDLDTAADVMIRHLNQPNPIDALTYVQEYEPPDIKTPAMVEYSERYKTMTSRADVQAAIDKAGRILPTPLPVVN